VKNLVEIVENSVDKQANFSTKIFNIFFHKKINKFSPNFSTAIFLVRKGKEKFSIKKPQDIIYIS